MRRLLILLAIPLLCAWPSMNLGGGATAAAGGGGGATLDANSAANATSSTSNAPAAVAAVTGGRMILACAHDGSTSDITAVSDTCGSSSYTTVADLGATGRVVFIAYGSSAVDATGDCTITATVAASVNSNCVAMAWSGVDVDSTDNGSSGSFGSTCTSTDADPAGTSNVLFIGAGTHTGGSTTITPEAGWTEVAEDEDVTLMPINVSYLVREDGTGDGVVTTYGASRGYNCATAAMGPAS